MVGKFQHIQTLQSCRLYVFEVIGSNQSTEVITDPIKYCF